MQQRQQQQHRRQSGARAPPLPGDLFSLCVIYASLVKSALVFVVVVVVVLPATRRSQNDDDWPAEQPRNSRRRRQRGASRAGSTLGPGICIALVIGNRLPPRRRAPTWQRPRLPQPLLMPQIESKSELFPIPKFTLRLRRRRRRRWRWRRRGRRNCSLPASPQPELGRRSISI